MEFRVEIGRDEFEMLIYGVVFLLRDDDVVLVRREFRDKISLHLERRQPRNNPSSEHVAL